MTTAEIVRLQNEAFDALDLKEKKREIARDVLKLIDVGCVIPTCGTYGRFDFPEAFLDENEQYIAADRADELQPAAFRGAMPTCRACMLGSLFFGLLGRTQTKIKDRFRDWNHCHGGSMLGALAEYFDAAERDDIEELFEGSAIRGPEVWFSFLYMVEPKDRMVCICNHLITHGGLNYVELQKEVEQINARFTRPEVVVSDPGSIQL